MKSLIFCAFSAILILFSACAVFAESQSPHVELIYPNGDELFKVGSKISIVWQCDTNHLNAPAVEYSWNDGVTWAVISDADTIEWDTIDADTFGFTWTIPESLMNFIDLKMYPVVSGEARIRITQYSEYSISDVSDKTFKIVSANSAVRNPSLRINIAGSRACAEAYMLNGRRYASQKQYRIRAPYSGILAQTYMKERESFSNLIPHKTIMLGGRQ